MKERKKKDLYIKCGKKRYWARECKELDPEQRNDKEKVVSIIRLINSISYRTRLAFKVEVQKGDSWISIKALLDSGAERNFII